MRGLRLRGPGGTLYRLRCCRRDCAYCGRLADFELAQVLLLDARESPPSTAVTLTTADPDMPASVYRNGSAVLWRELRAAFGRDVEYAACVEWTTGEARRSGGRRRMHGHHLVKGLPPTAVLEAEAIARETWERATGAWRVEVAALISPGAAIPYLGLHHRKPEQAPPSDWSGKRFRASQGYFHRPVGELRELARQEQRRRRLRWQMKAAGIDHDTATVLAQLEAEMQLDAWAAAAVEVVRVREHPTKPGGVVEPCFVR